MNGLGEMPAAKCG